MIELNLTYEESKKILELGYNFGNICTKFELRNNDEVKINFGEKISSKSIRSQYTLIDNESWFQGIAWIENFVPIIPKAALEACLPDYFFAGGSNSIRLHHNSAYEAFTWCHEHHPEELRKKFNEVMA